MCGIVGYFGSEDVDLKRSAARDAAPWPRHAGNHVRQRAGRSRSTGSSIIDVSDNGMQPFSFEGVTVVMNGEIYNYKELREEHKSEFTCQLRKRCRDRAVSLQEIRHRVPASG